MLLQIVWGPRAGGLTQRDYMKPLKPSQPACIPALLLPDLYLHAKHGSEVGCKENCCKTVWAFTGNVRELYAGPGPLQLARSAALPLLL